MTPRPLEEVAKELTNLRYARFDNARLDRLLDELRASLAEREKEIEKEKPADRPNTKCPVCGSDLHEFLPHVCISW